MDPPGSAEIATHLVGFLFIKNSLVIGIFGRVQGASADCD